MPLLRLLILSAGIATVSNALSVQQSYSRCELHRGKKNTLENVFKPLCHADGTYKCVQNIPEYGVSFAVDQHGKLYPDTITKGLATCPFEKDILSSIICNSNLQRRITCEKNHVIDVKTVVISSESTAECQCAQRLYIVSRPSNIDSSKCNTTLLKRNVLRSCHGRKTCLVHLPNALRGTNCTMENVTMAEIKFQCNRGKDGYCPLVNQTRSIPHLPGCHNNCTLDRECPGTLKCCRTGCGKGCLQPNPERQIIIRGSSTSSTSRVPFSRPRLETTSRSTSCLSLPCEMYEKNTTNPTVCPDNKSMMKNCPRVLCDVIQCASKSLRSLTCHVNPCGTCQPEFYDTLGNKIDCTIKILHRCHAARIIMKYRKPYHLLPKCNASGEFLQVQCDALNTTCWCVDEFGRERNGTRQSMKGEPPLVCNGTQPGVSACQYRRHQMLKRIEAYNASCNRRGGTDRRRSACLRVKRMNVPTCVSIGTVRPGSCPLLPSNVSSTCYSICEGDDDCDEGLKCCNVGCGKTCLRPVVQACSAGQQFKMCLHGDACRCAGCPAHPHTRCHMNPCNDCKPEFYFKNGSRVDCGDCPNGNKAVWCPPIHCRSAKCSHPKGVCRMDPCNNCKIYFVDSHGNKLNCSFHEESDGTYKTLQALEKDTKCQRMTKGFYSERTAMPHPHIGPTRNALIQTRGANVPSMSSQPQGMGRRGRRGRRSVATLDPLLPYGTYFPQCDAEGLFRLVQCKVVQNSRKCWCVNSSTGHVTRELQPDEETTSYSCRFTRCQRMRKGYYSNTTKIDVPGMNGSLVLGTPPAPPRRRRSSSSQDLKLPFGRYLPNCEANGLFEHVQCKTIDGNEKCWCVNEYSGHLTRELQAGEAKTSISCRILTKCQHMRNGNSGKTTASPVTIGTRHYLIQPRGISPRGIPGPVTSPPNTEPTDASSTTTSILAPTGNTGSSLSASSRKRRSASAQDPLLPAYGQYVPQCDAMGLFELVQCKLVHGSQKCWCVNASTGHVTRELQPDEEKISYSCLLTKCQRMKKDYYSSTTTTPPSTTAPSTPPPSSTPTRNPVIQPRGPGRIAPRGLSPASPRKRQSAPPQDLKLPYGWYLPQCEDNGLFKHVQCKTGDGNEKCWCVNEYSGYLMRELQSDEEKTSSSCTSKVINPPVKNGNTKPTPREPSGEKGKEKGTPQRQTIYNVQIRFDGRYEDFDNAEGKTKLEEAVIEECGKRFTNVDSEKDIHNIRISKGSIIVHFDIVIASDAAEKAEGIQDALEQLKAEVTNKTFVLVLEDGTELRSSGHFKMFALEREFDNSVVYLESDPNAMEMLAVGIVVGILSSSIIYILRCILIRYRNTKRLKLSQKKDKIDNVHMGPAYQEVKLPRSRKNTERPPGDGQVLPDQSETSTSSN